MPLTEKGFKRRTFDEILTAKIEKAKELFGEDIDTSELTPFGKFIRINAYDQALTEEEAELIYYSIFPNTAMGTSLDRLCVFAGIKRNPATFARYKVSIIGTAGTTIAKGFLVGTENDIHFKSIEDVTIDGNGTAFITVDCETSGNLGNVPPSSISQIINPSASIEGINTTANSLISQGEEVENDYELRTRFSAAKQGLGSCNEVAITSALLRVPTVTTAGVVVNETDTTDSSGRPARSFECYVSGGIDYHEQIAETIFDKKPLGIKTYGTVSQDIVDSGGNVHTIRFSHTTVVPVYVRIAINTNSEFEGETGKKEIKSNLDTYVNSLGIGNTLFLSSLYGKIHSVTGVKEVTNLELSTDGSNWNTNNITVEQYENCLLTQVAIKQNNESDYEVITND